MNRGLLLVAAFLSGAAALIYEICWLREAAVVFGSATQAVATVLAVFFGGLALGSAVAGRIAPRLARPLLAFGLVEGALGLLALASPALFDLADLLWGRVLATSGPGTLADVARVALVATVMLPPTALMGATLPLLTRQIVTRDDRVARPVGVLYGVNTLGAACGCALAGFALLPSLGVTTTLRIGVALDLAIALAVVALARGVGVPAAMRAREARVPDADPATSAAARAGDALSGEHRILGLLLLVSGFVALGNEVVWTRHLALIVPGTALAWASMLTVVLAGLVIGSIAAGAIADRVASRARLFGWLQAAGGLAVLAVLLLPVATWRGATPLRAMLLFLPPAIFSGASFPLAVRMLTGSAVRAPRAVGTALALNTLGGIAGSLALGFVGLPLLGLAGSAALTSGLGVAAGCAAWWLLERRTAPATLPLAVRTAAVVGAWLALPVLLPTSIPADHLVDPGDRLLAYREGLTSNVAVLERDGVRHLEIDRWWQGEDRRNHQLVAAHLPMLLHDDPRSVLVVGVGTGQTPSRVLAWDPEELHVVDIEPAVFDVVAEHFDGTWMSEPRVRCLLGDGRAAIAHGTRQYDVISLELGQLFRPGVAAFYTTEFYEQARERLRPGGILSQFVPLTFLTGEELRRTVASFREVFPACALFYNTAELLLVGAAGPDMRLRAGAAGDPALRSRLTREPLAPGLRPARLQRFREDPAFAADREYRHWGGPAQRLGRPGVLEGLFLSGPLGLAALAGDAEPHDDDHPALEYAAARVAPTETREIPLAELLRAHLDPIAKGIAGNRDDALDEELGGTLAGARDDALDGTPTGAPREETLAFAAEMRDRNLDDLVASAWLRRAEQEAASGTDARAALLARAVAANGESLAARRALGDAHLRGNRPDAALPHLAAAVRIDGDDAPSRRGLAVALHQLGRLDEAVPHYRRALLLQPDEGETHNNLGAALAQLGKLQEALEHFEEAVRLRPDDAEAQRNRDQARAALGR